MAAGFQEEALPKGTPQYASTYQAVACIILADVPLAYTTLAQRSLKTRCYFQGPPAEGLLIAQVTQKSDSRTLGL